MYGTPGSTTAYNTESMELCTPVESVRSTCTPGTNRRSSGMELCTPFTENTWTPRYQVNKGVSTMDLCTPYSQSTRSESMELCTPYTNPTILPLATENKLTSLEMCTPCSETDLIRRGNLRNSTEKSVRFLLSSPEYRNTRGTIRSDQGSFNSSDPDHINLCDLGPSISSDPGLINLSVPGPILFSDLGLITSSDPGIISLSDPGYITSLDTGPVNFSTPGPNPEEIILALKAASIKPDIKVEGLEGSLVDVAPKIVAESITVSVECEAEVDAASELSCWVMWPRPVKGFSELPF